MSRHWGRLLLVHPNMDPAEITAGMRLQPSSAQRAGEPRKNRAGPLEGVYRDSRWGFRVEAADGDGNDMLRTLIEHLEPAREFLHRFEAAGGTAMAIVAWGDEAPAGREFSWQLVERLGALRVSLGVDVYQGPPEGTLSTKPQ